MGCVRSSSGGGSWRPPGQDPPPDNSSSPALHVWACQVFLADSPAVWPNSPPGGDHLKTLLLSSLKCPRHTAADQIIWLQSRSLISSLRCSGTRYTYEPPYLRTWKSNNETPLGFRLSESFLPITPAGFLCHSPQALKSPRRTMGLAGDTLSRTTPTDSKRAGYSGQLFGLYAQTTVRALLPATRRRREATLSFSGENSNTAAARPAARSI